MLTPRIWPRAALVWDKQNCELIAFASRPDFNLPGSAEGAEVAAECWRGSLSFSDSLSSEQATPSWAKLVIARSSGNVTRGGTVGAFCCREVRGRTNARNSVVSCRRDFNSVDKSCTDSVKDCKTSGFVEAVAPTSSVCSSSSTASRSCSVSLRTGPAQFFPGRPKSWADYLTPYNLGTCLDDPLGWNERRNETVRCKTLVYAQGKNWLEMKHKTPITW